MGILNQLSYFAVIKQPGKLYYLHPDPLDFDRALNLIKSGRIFMAVPAADVRAAAEILSKRGTVRVVAPDSHTVP